METALLYYDYTDRIPDEWHIAVDNRSGRTRFFIEHPKVKPHFIKQDRLDIGKSEGEIDGIKVNIYDRERVICDCLRHINRMDGEIFNKAIKRYVTDSRKDIARLMEYAKKLGVEDKVRRLRYGCKRYGGISIDKIKKPGKRDWFNLSDVSAALLSGGIFEKIRGIGIF